MLKPPVPTITHERAAELRRESTDAERKLWMHLRAARSKFLESRGLSILRFRDHDVLIRTNEVLAAIVEFAANRTLSPTPLPEGEGLKSETT